MDKLTVDAIRVLSADAIEKAKSGHPGLPLGAAPIGYELFAHHLNVSAKDTRWINRDRFILSAFTDARYFVIRSPSKRLSLT